MKKCPYCGRDNNEYVKVCTSCYAQLPVEEVEKDKTEHEEIRASRKKTRS